MDFDETMTTSTSSTTPSALQDMVDTDEGFEDASRTADYARSSTAHEHPRTPVNDHLNASAPGELSPPRSQPGSDERSANTSANSLASIPNGGHVIGANTSATRRAVRPAGGPLVENKTEEGNNVIPSGANGQEQRPGGAWKSKKAQEEMQRAWDNVVDRDFSTREYGDVMMLSRAQMPSR